MAAIRSRVLPSEIGPAPFPARSSPSAADRAANPATQSRALVPIAPSRLQDARPTSRVPCAAFLAHLIATAQQAPQTRARRRAEPADACAAYATASTAIPASTRYCSL
jgi:hypothetical protein